MIKVLIVDDHHMVRRGLRFFLGTQPDFEVVGEATNGEEALIAAEAYHPNIILMDLMMPQMDGVEATKRIKASFPDIKIIVLTSFSDQDHVIPAIRAGASGYQLKDIEPDELVATIRSIYNGEIEWHPKITKKVMAHLTTNQEEEENLIMRLTEREKEVLAEIANGKSNKEIAIALIITEKTVKTHVSNILAKLELADRTQAALYAVKHGL